MSWSPTVHSPLRSTGCGSFVRKRPLLGSASSEDRVKWNVMSKWVASIGAPSFIFCFHSFLLSAAHASNDSLDENQVPLSLWLWIDTTADAGIHDRELTGNPCQCTKYSSLPFTVLCLIILSIRYVVVGVVSTCWTS